MDLTKYPRRHQEDRLSPGGGRQLLDQQTLGPLPGLAMFVRAVVKMHDLSVAL